MNVSEELIRTIVEQVIRETCKGETAMERQVDPSGVIGVKTSSVTLDSFDGRDDVLLKDVLSLEEAPRMGCGVMELNDGADFEWTLTYDEYDIILEGELEIVIDGRVVRGGPGDIIYIPKNTHIHFRTPRHTKYVYTVFPADWSNT